MDDLRMPTESNLDRLHTAMQREYFAIAEVVAEFDRRLLTIKSWGVTFSLATVALGFQQGQHGLFLVAGASGASFWLIEWSIKRQQFRYYPRMGDIEYESFELFGVQRKDGGISTSPLIDWSWYTAQARIFGVSRRRPSSATSSPYRPKQWAKENLQPGAYTWMLLWPSIALPHMVVLASGLVLFVIGLLGGFGSP